VEGQPVTVVCRTILLDGRLVRLYMGGSVEDDMYILSIYQRALLFLLPCLLGLAAAGGYFLSRRAMRPVDRMTKAALDIGIGNLWSVKFAGSSEPGKVGACSASSGGGPNAEILEPGFALQTHHHRGTGIFGGGIALCWEFSLPIRDPPSK
jgi:hypothetical protein